MKTLPECTEIAMGRMDDFYVFLSMCYGPDAPYPEWLAHNEHKLLRMFLCQMVEDELLTDNDLEKVEASVMARIIEQGIRGKKGGQVGTA